MAHLYENAKGFPVKTHSFSGGEDWRFCPRKYKLARVVGWREREQRVATEFGKTIEAAIQAHLLRGHALVEAFHGAWRNFKPGIEADCTHGKERPCSACKAQGARNAALVYTDKERDWARMEEMGVGLMRLFGAILPSLPLVKPRFAIELKKEVFPGTVLDGIYFNAILDILCSPPACHPLLPNVKADFNIQNSRPLVVDVKTTSRAYPSEPGIVGLDNQLAAYSWASGVPDVAFLTFVKASPELERGTEVRALIDWKGVKAGADLVCIEPVDDGAAWLLLPKQEEALSALKEFTNGLSGKLRTQKRMEFALHAGLALQANAVTTQRIQFLPARIAEEDAAEAGRSIGKQIAEIHAAAKAGDFPKTGGIRWPNDRCLNCQMRGICSHNDELRDALVYKLDEQWLEGEEAA